MSYINLVSNLFSGLKINFLVFLFSLAIFNIGMVYSHDGEPPHWYSFMTKERPEMYEKYKQINKEMSKVFHSKRLEELKKSREMQRKKISEYRLSPEAKKEAIKRSEVRLRISKLAIKAGFLNEEEQRLNPLRRMELVSQKVKGQNGEQVSELKSLLAEYNQLEKEHRDRTRIKIINSPNLKNLYEQDPKYRALKNELDEIEAQMKNAAKASDKK